MTLRTTVHTRYMYGLGEHQKRFLIDTCAPHSFTFWARDQPPKVRWQYPQLNQHPYIHVVCHGYAFISCIQNLVFLFSLLLIIICYAYDM